MTYSISIRNNIKILQHIDNPYYQVGRATFMEIIRPNIQFWLVATCKSNYQIIFEKTTPRYDAITNIIFDNKEDATLFQLTWL